MAHLTLNVCSSKLYHIRDGADKRGNRNCSQTCVHHHRHCLPRPLPPHPTWVGQYLHYCCCCSCRRHCSTTSSVTSAGSTHSKTTTTTQVKETEAATTHFTSLLFRATFREIHNAHCLFVCLSFRLSWLPLRHGDLLAGFV